MDQKKRAIDSDIFVALVLFAFSAFALYNSRDFMGTDSAFLPIACIILITAFSCKILYDGIKNTIKLNQTLAQMSEEDSLAADEKKAAEKKDNKVAIIAFLYTAVYVLLFYLAGFFISTPLYFFSFARYLKKTPWKVLIITIGIFLLIVYFLFMKELGVRIGGFGRLGKLIG